MMRRLLLAIVLPLALGLTACERRREPVVVARFDAAMKTEDPVYGPGWLQPRGLHLFGQGWRAPEPQGIWTTNLPAEIHFETEGRAGRLTLCLSTHPVLAERGQTYSVFWNDTRLATRSLPTGWRPDTLQVDLPKADFGRGTATLRIESTQCLRPEDGFAEPRALFVRSLRLTAQLTPKERTHWHELIASSPKPAMAPITRAIAGGRPTEPRPDVLMILVDAARADHFSSYGYRRATTPHADAVAGEGVQFERVFANAPYTRCSVASLFSGRSWRDHGVIGTDRALGPENYTLAESLHDAGYQTLGISDNANVGVHAGSDQGFDEFIEAWKGFDEERAKRPLRWWPEAPLEYFESRLKQGFDPARPVFTYLHLLPPHEPYYPTPEHDLFQDRPYSGPITGITPDIVSFDRGEHPAHGPDYDRLVALYDGSLHRADALVQRALEAWKALDRPRPTLIVLLSDHGEAFGEHQRFGHNSTPFDEMLHVPLILAPRALLPDAVQESASAFHSLEDVYPMLLHVLGVGFPGDVAMPPAFFETLDDPARSRDEIFVRCSVPRFARRTPTSLAIFRDWHEQRLFDLTTDPAAQSDLRESDSERWREQWRRLREFLDASPGADAAATSELSPEDIERLKALGYM